MVRSASQEDVTGCFVRHDVWRGLYLRTIEEGPSELGMLTGNPQAGNLTNGVGRKIGESRGWAR